MMTIGAGDTSALIFAAAVYPSIFGIITSSSTTSGCSACAVSKPSRPFVAVRTSNPSFRSLIWIRRLTSSSSSTARILMLTSASSRGHELAHLGDQRVEIDRLLNEIGHAQRERPGPNLGANRFAPGHHGDRNGCRLRTRLERSEDGHIGEIRQA